ncbi:4776_t:CDS:2 [Cetraspora pellucida]|uniref:4776_t:CDS:1 n=1 Tax=Cetraspora pellucida TaxID=1433469 RepID=A0ACA9KZN9_9GLOM|nr:4776_t:CDS:2 [Cetraspora pellucida]
MELQSKVYTREEIVETFLGFLEFYEDFDNTEPCWQEFNANITVHLNSFFDYIEETNEDEINKHIAYQIIKLISKADRYTYIYHTCNKLKDDLTWYPKPRNQQVLNELSSTNLLNNKSVVNPDKHKIFCQKDQYEYII